MKFKLTPMKGIGAVFVYAASLAWMHHLTRDEFNRQYFKQYVMARCTSKQTSDRSIHRTPERLGEMAEEMKRCQGMDVKVDGVWGGIWGAPSVRLKITFEGGRTEFKHYKVSVSPVMGNAIVDHELAHPYYYYINL